VELTVKITKECDHYRSGVCIYAHQVKNEECIPTEQENRWAVIPTVPKI
jgi:hypothetical protein